MRAMTWQEALREAMRLQRKWVGQAYIGQYGCTGSGYELDRIHSSILREARFHRSGKSTASAGLISETKGDLIRLGKIRKVLAPKSCGHQLTELETEYYQNHSDLDRLCKRCVMEERAR